MVKWYHLMDFPVLVRFTHQLPLLEKNPDYSHPWINIPSSWQTSEVSSHPARANSSLWQVFQAWGLVVTWPGRLIQVRRDKIPHCLHVRTESPREEAFICIQSPRGGPAPSGLWVTFLRWSVHVQLVRFCGHFCVWGEGITVAEWWRFFLVLLPPETRVTGHEKAQTDWGKISARSLGTILPRHCSDT